MKCVVCGKPVPHRTVDAGGMNPWCSNPCAARWRTRNNFLFTLPQGAIGEKVAALLTQRGEFDDDERTLGQLAQVSTTIRPLAKVHEIGASFHRPAVHQQQQGYKTITETVVETKTVPGKFVRVEKQTKAGKPFFRDVPMTREVKSVVSRSVPDIHRVDISPDRMLEIALMAYNTAIELKAKNKPVILYRVDSKGYLNKAERDVQTLSSSVHATVGGTEVWPLAKTAAWIQGAMRARISFVLLDDPRAKGILIGGINKASDAIYVREIHQVTSMHYTIDVATLDETPSGLKPPGKEPQKCFILRPPEKEIGVLPLVPRITGDDWSHTWNSAKSNLKLADDPGLIRDHLRKQFVEVGDAMNPKLPLYG